MADLNQLHREGAKHQKEIEELYYKLTQGEFDPSFQSTISLAARFFGKNLQTLVECNETILKVGRLFLDLAERKLLEWSPRDFNAVLQMTAMMLLKRKDEGVLRQTANLMIDFAKSLTAEQLKKLVSLQTKVTSLILQKLNRVGTYYTQMKILFMLKTFLSSLDDGGASIIRKDKIFIGDSNAAQKAVQLFQLIDEENFIWTSRAFLDFYNQDARQNGLVQTFEGFLLRINNHKKRSKATRMSFDFGLGNLSLSFFIAAGYIIHNHHNKNELILVELEECDIQTTSKDSAKVEIIVKPVRYQILDQHDRQLQVDYEIKSFSLFVVEKNGSFMTNIYPRFKDKNPMIAKDGTDSLISYRTVNTSIVNLNFNSHIEIPQLHVKPTQSQDILTPAEKVKENQEPPSKRKTAKIVPTVNVNDRQADSGVENRKRIDLAVSQDYDEIPNDEEPLPTFRKFMTNKRNDRKDQATVDEIPVNVEATINEVDCKKSRKTKKQKDTKLIPKTPNVEDNIQTYLTDSETENVSVAPVLTTAPARKIALRASPKRNPRGKEVTNKKGNAVPDQSENRKQPTHVKREPFANLGNNETQRIIRNPVKRTAEEVQQHSSLPSKRVCSDFDKLLTTMEPTVKTKEKRIHLSKEVKENNLTNKDMQVIETKQIENLQIERSIQSQYGSRPASQIAPITGRKRILDLTENTSLVPAKRVKAPSANESLTFSHSSHASSNPLLEKFLNDAVSRIHSEHSEVNFSFEEVTVNTHTIHKKVSPTIMRTVQVQDITYKPKQAPLISDVHGGNLRRIFNLKTEEDTYQAIKDIQMMEAAIKSEMADNKNAVLEVISKGRELIDKSENYIEEYYKLLKRLHHLEGQMTQNCDDISDYLPKLKEIVKSVFSDRRISIKKAMDELEMKTDKLAHKVQEAKAEIWKQYMNGIDRDFKNFIDSHRNF